MDFFTIRLKQGRIWIAMFLAIVLVMAMSSMGAAILIKEIPNPKKLDGSSIIDMADLIAPEQEDRLNQRIARVKAAQGTNILIVTVYGTAPANSPDSFSQELANTWKLTDSVVVLVAKDEAYANILVGAEVRHPPNPSQIQTILTRRVSPQLRQANFESAIIAATASLVPILNPPFWYRPLAIVFFSGLPLLLVLPVMYFSSQRITSSQRLSADKISRVRRHSGTRSPYSITFLNWLAPKTSAPLVASYGVTRRHHSREHMHLLDQGARILFVMLLALALVAMILLQLRSAFSWGISLLGGGGLCVWSWLGVEMWRGHDAAEAIDAVKKLAALSVAIFLLALLCGGLLLIVGGVLVLCFAFAGLGTYAGLLCIMRHTAAIGSVLCAECDRPLEKLSSAELEQYLQQTAPATTAVPHEGWRCPTCSPDNGPPKITLVPQQINSPAISTMTCQTCNLSIERIDSRILKRPTKGQSGLRMITARCPGCQVEYQTAEILDRR